MDYINNIDINPYHMPDKDVFLSAVFFLKMKVDFPGKLQLNALFPQN